MKFSIQRLEYGHCATYGHIVGDGFSGVTLEDPWRHNKRSESCIPLGNYIARRRFSPKRGIEVFELVNVPDRSDIQIHIGNTSDDTEGCILLGSDFGFVNQQLGIVNSRVTFSSFMAYLDGVSEIEVEIL